MSGPDEPDEAGRARTCGWRVPNATGDLGTADATVLVAMDGDLGMQDMTPPGTGEITPTARGLSTQGTDRSPRS